ncbi:MAG: 2-polyprenyl-6-hydroxyphenyl methylase/3-demethylubiquinone-9 3-methyltransferase [Polaribacter sp.]|jgi:2-polyprenyl-6-hydroxyphenyl methylase/3-demethylubiquinone-9 3-methyltransferase
MSKPSTIDPEEISYYDKLAKEWWDESGKFWPLHRLNRVREAYLKQQICLHFDRDVTMDNALQGLSVIDIGCGGGILAESMASLGATVTGIDVVPKSLQVARQHALSQHLDIEYIDSSAEEMLQSDQLYDVVLNMEVVEHVVELPTFISSCAQLVKTDGITFIATINRNPLSWLFAIVGAEYLLRWLPRGTHQWSKFVKPAELTALLADNGLVVTVESGVRVNPFNKRFSLTNNLHVNYMVAASAVKDLK